MVVVSLVEESFFKERIAKAVAGTVDTVEHHFCNSIEELKKHNPQRIFLDLEHPEAFATLRQYGSKVIAFGPYSEELFDGIKKTFGVVPYSRSVFINDLHKIL